MERDLRKLLMIALAIVVAIAVISALLISSGSFQVTPNKASQATVQEVKKGTIVVNLKDEETGKAIGKVDSGYVRVLLGGLDQGYLTDYGEVRINEVQPGGQELTLIIPRYGEVRRLVEVGEGQTVPVNIEVNMPNPVFRVGVDVTVTGAAWYQNLFRDSETGQIKLSLANTGDADSVGTSALVIVYRADDLSKPIATQIIDFPSLVPRKNAGEAVIREWTCSNFVYGPKEVVAVVVYDGWPYTPQNGRVVADVSVPSSMSAELASSVTNYLSQHPDQVISTVANIVTFLAG